MSYPKRTPRCLMVCWPVMKLMLGRAATEAEARGCNLTRKPRDLLTLSWLQVAAQTGFTALVDSAAILETAETSSFCCRLRHLLWDNSPAQSKRFTHVCCKLSGWVKSLHQRSCNGNSLWFPCCIFGDQFWHFCLRQPRLLSAWHDASAQNSSDVNMMIKVDIR